MMIPLPIYKKIHLVYVDLKLNSVMMDLVLATLNIVINPSVVAIRKLVNALLKVALVSKVAMIRISALVSENKDSVPQISA